MGLSSSKSAEEAAALREYLEFGKQFCRPPVMRAQMAFEILGRNFAVPERDATARIVLRLRPFINMEVQVSENTADELTARARERQRPWTTIDYYINRANGQENLDVLNETGRLDSLLPDHARGLNGQGPLDKESTVKLFLNSLHYFINNLEGKVWWNGFTMDLSGDPTTRLELIYHEMDPFRLIFNVKGIEKIDVNTDGTDNRFELIGKSMTLGEEPRTLKIWAPYLCKAIYMIPAKYGMLLLNFPAISK